MFKLNKPHLKNWNGMQLGNKSYDRKVVYFFLNTAKYSTIKCLNHW